jgi:4-aminobutyrate aminotransferase/(S)-3-amino-2-methylpropionate transaminase
VTIADEIWTGLGRSGRMASSAEWSPDILCFGKGLGGGLPVSACVGSPELMKTWSREAEVVHTSTFAGAPLSCATAIATLDVIAREQLTHRAEHVGTRFRQHLERALAGLPGAFQVRGQGLMIGVDVAAISGGASRVQRALLERGYLVSTGGGAREVLVLTPPLTISESLLEGFVAVLSAALESLSP